MKQFSYLTLVLALLFQLSNGHFLLRTPASIGYSDANESIGPCGGYNPTTFTGTVIDWPLGGRALGFTSTHSSVTWNFKAALVSAPTAFVYLTLPTLTQTGVPYFCEPQIPGYAAWVGQQAFIQITQTSGGDGSLYQCVRVRFVEGPAAAIPATGCTNSTGITAHW